MIKLNFAAIGAALGALLLVPSVANAELGVLVRDPEAGVSCEPLGEDGEESCESDDDCDGSATCQAVRAGTTVRRCSSTELKHEVLCCIGSSCCDAGEGCRSVTDGAECRTVSGLRDLFGDGSAVLCTPGVLDRCSAPTVGGSVTALRTCFRTSDGTETARFADGDCDGDSVANKADMCLCGCPMFDGEASCAGAEVDPETGCLFADMDAGTAEPDSGAGGDDAGPMTMDDGGAGGRDAGEPEEDAGPMGGFDAGEPPGDDTPNAGFAGDGGCECRASGGSTSGPAAGALLVLTALAWRRRRG